MKPSSRLFPRALGAGVRRFALFAAVVLAALPFAASAQTFHITYKITSIVPGAITDIFDFYSGHKVNEQGDFSSDAPPGLPTGSGTLNGGDWQGSDAHFLIGLAGNDLVMMMNPATAARMVGLPFDDMINGIGPGGVPNPFPVSGAEADIVERLKFRPAEWNNDVASFFDRTYRPNRLDPAVLIGPGNGVQTFTIMSFTDGKVIGSVGAQVTSVPEPGTWISMLAGLGVVGFCTRRSARA